MRWLVLSLVLLAACSEEKPLSWAETCVAYGEELCLRSAECGSTADSCVTDYVTICCEWAGDCTAASDVLPSEWDVCIEAVSQLSCEHLSSYPDECEW